MEKYYVYLEPNPRAIKNIPSFYQLFRNSMMIGGKLVDLSYMFRWVALCHRWPILSKALEEDPSLIGAKVETVEDEEIKNLLSQKDVERLIKGKETGDKPFDEPTIKMLTGL